MSSAFGTWVRMNMLNLRSPYNTGTRRYARRGGYDSIIPLKSEGVMEQKLLEFVSAAETKGNTVELENGVHAFRNKILAELKATEGAENGLFYKVLEEIDLLHKQKKEIEKLLSEKRIKSSLSTEQYNKIVKDVKQHWAEIFNDIFKDMNWIADLELDLAREGTRMRDFKVITDMGLKAIIGHAASQMQSLDIQEKKEDGSIVKLIKNFSPKKSEEELKELEKDFTEFIDIIKKEMSLIMEEIRALVIIIRDVEISLGKVFYKHVKGKLENDMHLPELTAKKIEKEFGEIFAEIKNSAKSFFEEGKFVAQKAAA